MADFTDIQQVIKFITELDQQAVQRLTMELQKLSKARVDEVRSSEAEVQTIQQQAVDKRVAMATRELAQLEDQLVSRVQKEMDQVKRIMDANEEKYKFVVDKAREAAQAQQDIARVLTERELEHYQKYLQNRDVLHKKQVDAEKERNAEANVPYGQSGVHGAASKVGSAIGFVSSALPGVTEAEKQTKIMGEMAGDVLKSRTPLEALTAIGKGIWNSLDLKIKEDARRGLEMIEAAGGSYVWRDGGLAHSAMKDVKKELEHVRFIVAERQAQLKPTMTAVMSSKPLESETMDLTATVLRVGGAAELLGVSWADLAKRVGDMSRKETMSFKDGLDATLRVFVTAQEVGKKIGEIDLKVFTNNVFSAQDALRPFGFTINDSTKLVTRFAGELDKGILSLNDLQQWVTGMTRADDSSRAFIFQQMSQVVNNDPRFADLAKVMNQSGKDPRSQSFIMQALAEGDESLKKLGVADPKAMANMFRSALGETGESFSEKNIGQGGSEVDRMARMDFFRKKFWDPLQGTQTEGMTLGQRRSLREHGLDSDFRSDMAPKMDEANKIANDQLKVLYETLFEVKQGQRGIAGKIGDVSWRHVDQVKAEQAAQAGRALGQMTIGIGGMGAISEANTWGQRHGKPYDVNTSAALGDIQGMGAHSSGGFLTMQRMTQMVGGDLSKYKFAGAGGKEVKPEDFVELYNEALKKHISGYTDYIGARLDKGEGFTQAVTDSDVWRGGKSSKGIGAQSISGITQDPMFYKKFPQFAGQEQKMFAGLEQDEKSAYAARRASMELNINVAVDDPALQKALKESIEDTIKAFMAGRQKSNIEEARDKMSTDLQTQTGTPPVRPR